LRFAQIHLPLEHGGREGGAFPQALVGFVGAFNAEVQLLMQHATAAQVAMTRKIEQQ
jgi:hypothetical protein